MAGFGESPGRSHRHVGHTAEAANTEEIRRRFLKMCLVFCCFFGRFVRLECGSFNPEWFGPMWQQDAALRREEAGFIFHIDPLSDKMKIYV